MSWRIQGSEIRDQGSEAAVFSVAAHEAPLQLSSWCGFQSDP
jgi:hypothetical protein